MKFFYTHINNFMYRHPFIKSTVFFLSKFCPYMVGVFFILFVLKIYLEVPNSLMILIARPLACFLLTLLLRLAFNRERPGEKYGFIPIDDKVRSGHSMPSIHTSLAFSIALTVLQTGPNMGVFLLVMAISITLSRILVGSHYMSDCVAGILIAYAIQLV